MSRPVRAVLYGVGAMAPITVEVLESRGVEIVGAVARSPEKDGRDLGDVIGLGRKLGVRVGVDADAVLAETRPDVVLLSTVSHMGAHAPQIEACVRAGANVVTLTEEAFHPWATSPAIAAGLDALAREHGVTIVATGHQDAFWFGLGMQVMGQMSRVDAVEWSSLWNPDGVGQDLLEAMHIGTPASEVGAIEPDPEAPSFAIAAVDGIADALGLDGKTSVTIVPVVAEAAVQCGTLGREIAIGEVVGMAETVERIPNDGPRLRFSMVGRILAPGEWSGETWSFAGTPTMRLESGYEPEHHAQVAAAQVHRIHDAIEAPPGYARIADLPLLRHRRTLEIAE